MADRGVVALEECVAKPELAAAHWEFLLQSVESDDESTLELATEALENCGPVPNQDMSRLMAQLGEASFSHGGPQRQYWLCTLMGRSGAAGSEAQGSVAAIVAEPRYPMNVRERAAWCLGELGMLTSESRERLRGVRRDASPRLQRLVEAVLSQSKPA
jgi:hypothetical protein